MNAPASVRPLDFAPGLSLAADAHCLHFAAAQVGEPSDYAGSGTRLGRELGRAIFAATRQALIRSREARHG